MNELGNEVLNSYGDTVQIDAIKIRSVGLTGTIKVSTLSNMSVRGEGLDSLDLEQAFEENQLELDYVVELTDLAEVTVGGATATRSAKFGPKAIELEVPNAGEGWAQVALMTDENGVATWNFPVLENDEIDTTRSGDTVTFVLPGYVAHVESDASTRGVFGWLGKKIVRFISFKIADVIIGEVGEFFAERWEAKKRPYAIRSFTPADYTNLLGESLNESDWNDLAAGRALLFIHGTFSRASTGFGGLPEDCMQYLHQQYGGRVFAFDHPTLAPAPLENAQWFVDQIPDSMSLDLDIICHSRGGLVARMLTENQSDLDMKARSLRIGNVVFVASPNAGTVLADPKYMSDFIDSYTNLLNWVPTNAVTDTLDAIITVVKHLAAGVLKGLDGLQSMNPSGEFVNRVLNIGPTVGTKYLAVASDFDPTTKGLKDWAKDRLMDTIFKEANDLVVPTSGVAGANKDEMFPIADALQLGHSEGVTHGDYFSNDRVVKAIKGWLIR